MAYNISVLQDYCVFSFVSINDAQIKTLEDILIELIKKKSKITRIEMANHIDKSKATIERTIKNSTKIKYIGSSKTGYWEIVE